MSDEEEKALARVHIGELDYERDPKHENVLTPFYHCYVVTTAGQVWDVRSLAFNTTKDTIRKVWNSDRSKFTKREITTPLGV